MDFLTDHIDTIGVLVGAVVYILQKHRALASARAWLCAHREALKLVTDALENVSGDPGATAQDAKKAVAASETTVDQVVIKALHEVLDEMRERRTKQTP